MKIENSDDLLFSRNPKITVSDVRGWLDQLEHGDDGAKAQLVKFIDHRLRGRYITPLSNVPNEFKSGFLMVAVSCLLIETLQSFFKGINDTKRVSARSFANFFARNSDFFPGFAECFPGVANNDELNNFYYQIRCGILHQAETTGRYSILRDGSPLFDPGSKTINADQFLKAIQSCLDKYLNDLGAAKPTAELWKNAARKLTCICDNFEK